MDKTQEEYMLEEFGITLKGSLGQFFCGHRNTEWYDGVIRWNSYGVKTYLICKDCGATVNYGYRDLKKELEDDE